MSTTKKNYIYEDREYGDVARRRSKVDVQGHEVPLSEFDKPYLKNNEEDDTYQSYEEEWGDCVSPPCPDLIPTVDRPPTVSPCSSADGCGHVRIFRDFPDTIDCEDEYWFRTTHEVHGCEPATWEDAFIGWEVSAGEILSQTVGMKWKAPDCCDEDKVTIKSFGLPDCQDAVEITLDCVECCEEFEITGDETVNADTYWYGTVTPACPDGTLEVTSLSGCEIVSQSLNDEGSQITVSTAGLCGSFSVVLTDEGEDCVGYSDTFVVRVNAGSWSVCNTISDFGGPCYAHVSGDECPDNFIDNIRGGYAARMARGRDECPGGCRDVECDDDPLGTWNLCWYCGNSGAKPYTWTTWKWGCTC